LVIQLALEGQVEREGAEHEDQAEGQRPRAVDGNEAEVLARAHHDAMGLPEQRVVGAQRVRGGEGKGKV